MPSEPVVVTLRPNGPIVITGKIEVKRPDGTVLSRDTDIALCRCGHSQTKPFCDKSHKRVGFKAE